MRVSPSATQDEVDDFITSVLNKQNIDDSANVLYFDDEVFICAKPICPYCDMDFGYHSFLGQHLDGERCDN